MEKIVLYIAIAFAVVIFILLGFLFFVPVGKAPSSTVSVARQTTISSPDGGIVITLPEKDPVIVSPLVATGTAKGNWFFEASFPVKVLDGDGTVLGQGPAQAQGDWMTTGTVPFSVTLSFLTPHFVTGTIMFLKDNPSGLPQNAGSFSVPVRFK
jgi:hypothetical protein